MTKRPGEGGTISVPGPRAGWTLAAWMVAHAQPYGLREVRYGGRHWRAAQGHDGWTTDTGAPTDRVLIR